VLPDLERGGGQVVVLQLAAHRDASRFDVHVARLQGPDRVAPAFRALGVEPILLDHGDDGLAAAAFELGRHVRHRDIDIIHVHSDQDRKVGQLAAVLTGRPVVGHLHSPWPHLDAMAPSRPGVLPAELSELKAVGRRAVERRVVQHYIAAGAEVAAFHVGLVDAPIAIVDNGIDVDRFTPMPAARRRSVRQQLGIGPEQPMLACVGRLAVGKGQDELISIVADLPGVHLVLVGDGDRWRIVEQLARWLDVDDRVHFTGDRADVADLVGAADLFVLASISEGLPLSVLEAMASAVPVVAYDLPGLRQVVHDGVDGVLVPMGHRSAFVEQVRALLDHPSRRAAMAVAARATVVARFDARGMARATEAVYDVVLGNDPLDARRHDAHRLASSF
jgi:glycosyltransferase involved in cell wall biosynthesis